ncbi:hypothetical protein T8K17_07345 [Thalassobaculum sp. OXR-137]|uniref:hypothetical protein n=1 Tax=Thalassobaculum sp. OXR-137 TaxID=3100173 RepID=UPI002AC8D083|nr:hypothetical protein [Thalassobaculum sp. OXR-137]WPZ35948.1 hypothetical protein T8K17_07345 [Thalassobaculum sp. OXR-137]
MTRGIALFLIGLVFGGGSGFLLAASQGVTLDGHDHGDPAQHVAMHQHGAAMEVASAGLSIDLRPDPMGGWNLHIEPSGFRFAPEHASGPHVPGEGHAHVYVNGEKIARAYGPWLHIASLPPGRVEVMVSLNTNDHRPISVDGKPLEASVTVQN